MTGRVIQRVGDAILPLPIAADLDVVALSGAGVGRAVGVGDDRADVLGAAVGVVGRLGAEVGGVRPPCAPLSEKSVERIPDEQKVGGAAVGVHRDVCGLASIEPIEQLVSVCDHFSRRLVGAVNMLQLLRRETP